MTRDKSDAQLDAERFWSKVNRTPTCWLWTGAITGDGYGGFRHDGRQLPAHRIAWRLVGRTLDPGLTIDHLCRVRHCVNPDHLRQITNRENVLIGLGPPAVNARKTHCKHGHPLEGDNLIIRTNGNRDCRACARARGLRYWHRRNAA